MSSSEGSPSLSVNSVVEIRRSHPERRDGDIDKLMAQIFSPPSSPEKTEPIKAKPTPKKVSSPIKAKPTPKKIVSKIETPKKLPTKAALRKIELAAAKASAEPVNPIKKGFIFYNSF